MSKVEIKPLTDDERKAKRALLALSIIGFLFAKYNLLPTGLPSLGIDSLDPNLPIRTLLIVAIAYFVVNLAITWIWAHFNRLTRYDGLQKGWVLKNQDNIKIFLPKPAAYLCVMWLRGVPIAIGIAAIILLI